MANSFSFVGGKKYTLAGSGVSSSASTIVLTSFKLPVSDDEITISDFGDIGYGTLEPGTSRQEFISFTGVTQNADGTATLTGVTRGLKPNSEYSEDSDYKVSHSGGTSFIISNSTPFYNEGTFKRNDETITGSWNFPTPVSDDNPATKKYVDDNVSGGTVTKESEVVAGTAGETVAEGDLVYFDTTDNEWKKADASTATTVNDVKLGIAQGAGTNGNSISGGVLLSGVDKTQTGMTAGDLMYASDTAGEISSSAGTTERVIGIARNATNLYFDPNFSYTPTADEKDAMAGGGDLGTPSGTNKFQTQKGVNSIGAFGDGSDGDVTISSPTTLTRDMYYDNLTVNDTLTTDGYRVFVKNTLSGNGTIKAPDANDGQNGANAAASADGSDGDGGASEGNGYFPNRAGTDGSDSPTADIGGLGNPGGQAAAGGGRTTPTAPSNNANIPFVSEFNYGIGISPVWGLDIDPSTGNTLYYKAPAGGQGGSRGVRQSQAGGNATGGAGGAGGGGASGGVVWISARIWAGTFTIMAIGGDGGDAGDSSNGYFTIGQSTGGAGGAGGVAVIFYGQKTWTGSYALTGGVKGDNGGGTYDTAAAGESENGPTGEYFEIEL